jgi:predicted DNA-binding protein
MDDTVRTQIYLKKKQYEALKRLAEEESVSMAHLIWEAVAHYLTERGDDIELDEEAYRNDPLWKIPQIARQIGPSGIAGGSVNHDEVVYDLDNPTRGEGVRP